MRSSVSAVDIDAEKVARVASLLRRAIVGDATRPEVLEKAGARQAETAIVSTGDDVASSVLTALALRDLGVSDIYVKVVSELHGKILDRVGVARTIFPERESAESLAKRLQSRALLDYVELGAGLSVQEMAVPRSWIGRTLRELDLPRRYGISVVAVRDYLSDAVDAVPDADKRLSDSDSLLVAGSDDDLAKMAKRTE